jgi:X-X-X-Leu-X-X-Gly heptad repeat protein
VPVRAPAQEEVLQLKPIEDIRKELESKMPREKAAGAKEKAKAVALDEPVASPIKSDISEDKLSGPVSAPSNPPAADASDLSAGMSDLSAGMSDLSAGMSDLSAGARWISLSQLPMLGQAAENPTAPENPTTAPNSTPEAESAWATSPPKPAAPPAETIAPAPSHTPASEESSGISAQELAERSVRLREVVASETFARLLARQGYTEKAIAMYEKLCLLFPDKSAYFAAEIQKLKK